VGFPKSPARTHIGQAEAGASLAWGSIRDMAAEPPQRLTAGDRDCPLLVAGLWPRCGPARGLALAFRSRPVADASGAPVLRDQGPIGRPGTARPMQALTSDYLLPKPDGAGAPAVEVVNNTGHGHHGVVRECPLGTGQDCSEWHASSTDGEDDFGQAVMPSAHLDRG
jgi:hypothetical protein